MYLLEHDAKELLAAHGVNVPAGRLIERADELDGMSLPDGPWVAKGQISAGGRGKAGLIQDADTARELKARVAEILGRTVHGRTVKAVRVEQRVGGARESYLGFLLDPARGGARVIASARGGVDIEQVPHGEIFSDATRMDAAAIVANVRKLSDRLPPEVARAARAAAGQLARAFLGLEALLLEVNPLFVREDGSWLAGDAKLVTDDNAFPRQPALRALVEKRAHAYPEVALKLAHGFDYVVVDGAGEIALLTTGAGLSMMLIDELRAAGLRPYNFLDIRTGGLRGETGRLVQALGWMAEGKSVKVLLVNIFAGITDLGEFARLLLSALKETPRLRLPVVARLIGNGYAEAREVLAAAGIAVHTDLDAALTAVRAHLDDG
jgi:succinyl-CoA synthetase beta subunit